MKNNHNSCLLRKDLRNGEKNTHIFLLTTLPIRVELRVNGMSNDLEMFFFLNRFNSSAAVAAAAAYNGVHNEFAANPTKRLPPAPPPPPPPPPPTAVPVAAASATVPVGYHSHGSSSSTAVSRWTQFSKPTVAAAASLVDCSSYFNNNLLWYQTNTIINM